MNWVSHPVISARVWAVLLSGAWAAAGFRCWKNGISTMDAANISVDHSVPTESVFAQQVEIFRGPATLLFGSGASGGVVNYVNGRILDYVPDNLEAEVTLQYETVARRYNRRRQHELRRRQLCHAYRWNDA